MLKWLLVLAVVVVVILLAKSSARRSEPPSRQPGEAKIEDMVRCHVCGVNLPRSEAILSRGRFYCGEEHRRQNGA